MADEITSSSGGVTLIVAATAAKLLLLMLADRTSLRGHPALIDVSAYGAGKLGAGSKSFSFPILGLDGYDTLAAVSEGSEAANIPLAGSQKTIAIARYGGSRSVTDWINSIDPTGVLTPERLAQSGYMEAMAALTSLIAGLASGFSTNTVGASGVDMDHDVVIAAKNKLITSKVPGPYLCVMYPSCFADWTTDLESRGGLTQWSPAAANMQILKGPGFQGTYDGIDFYTSDKIPASGSDRLNMMIGRGAICYAEQDVMLFGANPEDIVLKAGAVAVEKDREARFGRGFLVTHYYAGVVEGIDAAGVKMTAAE